MLRFLGFHNFTNQWTTFTGGRWLTEDDDPAALVVPPDPENDADNEPLAPENENECVWPADSLPVEAPAELFAL